MGFADLFFLYAFLPVCLLVYWAARKVAYRNLVLIAFSLVFYAWGDPIWVFLLLFNATVTYLHGLLISKYMGKSGAKLALVSALLINLSLLVVFKYSGFLITNINTVFSLELPLPNLGLPVGISFYTFKSISYILDCYWEKTEAQKNYLRFLLYVSLFPQLLAGPIVRYGTIAGEIEERKATVSDFDYGFTRIVIGLAKKVIIANNLSVVVGELFGGTVSQLTVVGTWYAVIAYTLQIYFDFSGYSDIAIGLGRIFGFHFNENFRHPFICKDISEFWQRWHISLGSFFRDYLFFVPVFGKRRKYLNLFLVWFSTGLWHGANWNYIIWGLYFGLFIFMETLLGNKRMKKIPVVLRHIYSKLIILIGFGIFFFEDPGDLLNFLKNLVFLNDNVFVDELTLVHIANHIFLLLLAVLLCLPIADSLEKLKKKHSVFIPVLGYAKTAACAALLVISSVMLVNATSSPFLYFQF